MSSKRLTDATCIPLGRTSAPLAAAAILVFILLAMGLASVSAADRPAAGGDCFLVPLDGQTTPSAGGPMAIADITVCYRALPAEFWSPAAAVLKAQVPPSATAPAPADPGRDGIAGDGPDPT